MNIRNFEIEILIGMLFFVALSKYLLNKATTAAVTSKLTKYS
jgi:hypothetical protein